MCAVSLGLIGASVLGSAIGGGMSMFNSAQASKKSYKYQQALMQLQYSLQRSLNQNAYQDTTYSMRQAGINPMLAISNGASSGSVGLNSVSQNPAQFEIDLANAVSSAQQLKNDKQRVENETNMTQSNIRKNDYEADLAHEQASFVNEQNRQLDTYGNLERQQGLINSAKQAQLLDAQIADVENQIKNRDLATNSAVQLNHSTAKYNNERSRGYSDSKSESLGGSIGKVGIHGSRSESHTY